MSRKRVALMLVVVATVLFAALYFRLHPSAATQEATVRTTLIRNGIIIDSVRFVSTDSPAAAEQHKAIAAQLTTSLGAVKKLPTATLTPQQRSQLKKFIEAEAYTLKLYSTNIDILYNVLSYSPADDIGTTDRSEQATRAEAASKGIASLLQKDIGDSYTIATNQISLSGKAHQSLVDAKACFARLSQHKTSAASCVQTFETARLALNQDLAGLWTNQRITQPRAAMTAVIKQLD